MKQTLGCLFPRQELYPSFRKRVQRQRYPQDADSFLREFFNMCNGAEPSAASVWIEDRIANRTCSILWQSNGERPASLAARFGKRTFFTHPDARRRIRRREELYPCESCIYRLDNTDGCTGMSKNKRVVLNLTPHTNEQSVKRHHGRPGDNLSNNTLWEGCIEHRAQFSILRLNSSKHRYLGFACCSERLKSFQIGSTGSSICKAPEYKTRGTAKG